MSTDDKVMIKGKGGLDDRGRWRSINAVLSSDKAAGWRCRSGKVNCLKNAVLQARAA